VISVYNCALQVHIDVVKLFEDTSNAVIADDLAWSATSAASLDRVSADEATSDASSAMARTSAVVMFKLVTKFEAYVAAVRADAAEFEAPTDALETSEMTLDVCAARLNAYVAMLLP
jgi:hypothetical protein